MANLSLTKGGTKHEIKHPSSVFDYNIALFYFFKKKKILIPNLKRIQQQMTLNLTVKTFHEKEALNVLNLHISFFQKSEANTARNHLFLTLSQTNVPVFILGLLSLTLSKKLVTQIITVNSTMQIFCSKLHCMS